MIFVPRRSSGSGVRYLVRTRIDRWFMCRNSRFWVFSHDSGFSAMVLGLGMVGNHQNTEINQFWDLSQAENRAKNRENEKNMLPRVFRHINGYVNLLCSQYDAPNPLQLLGKKNTSWVTAQISVPKTENRQNWQNDENYIEKSKISKVSNFVLIISGDV